MRLTQLFAQVGLAQGARDLGQRPQVFGRVVRRRQQGEDQVDRLLIQRAEVDRRFQPHKHAVHPVKSRQGGMRHRHAVPDAGGPEPFALHQTRQHLRRLEAKRPGRQFSDHRQGLSLGAGVHPGADRAGIQQFT